MERTTQTVPNVHPSYVARMDELQHELEVTQMDNCQLTVENDRLKEVEKNLRDQLHDCERDSYRLESQLEKAYEKQDQTEGPSQCRLKKNHSASRRSDGSTPYSKTGCATCLRR